MSIQPFTIAISQATLDDLRDRLARTCWPDEAENTGWNYGTNLGYLKELVEYWQHSYDWRAQETRLNQFTQFRADIDGSRLHFLHVRGKGPNPTPLLLIHGWPDSFYRFHKIIPLLTDPESTGGNPLDSFDVIVPSLPGFGFSDRPHFPGGMKSLRAASLLSTLMTEVLGYQHYAVGGGDIGSRVTRLLALAHPEHVLGIHLTDIGSPPQKGGLRMKSPCEQTRKGQNSCDVKAGQEGWPERAARANGACPSFSSFASLTRSANGCIIEAQEQLR